MRLWVSPTKCIELEEQPAVQSLYREIASRQTAYDWYGYIGLLPDPDPVLRKRGDGVQVLESLTADAHLMSVIQTRKLGTLKREYRWEPGSLSGEKPSRQAKALCAALRQDLERVDLFHLISQILDAPLYGLTPIELMWEPGSSGMRLRDLRALPCRWFGFDEYNNPKFLSFNNPWNGEALPFGKFVLARHFPSYDNPYGLRLLSRCFWPVTFKKGGIKFWVQFAEKYGMPFLVGKFRPGAGAAEQQEMLAKLSQMVQDAVAVIPEGNSVEIKEGLASGRTSSADNYGRLIALMDAEISKVIMGQTLTAEIGDKGSYAASQTHENVLEQYQEADQVLVKTAMEEVARLYGQVNAPGVPTPAFQWYEAEDPQTEMADRDKVLSETGVKFTKAYYVRKYGLQEDDFEIGPSAPPGGPETPPGFAEGEGFTSDQQAIEALVAATLTQGVKGSQEMVQKIMAVIDKADSFEALQEGLALAFPDMAGADFENVLSQAMLATDLWGRFQVRQEGADGR